MSEPQHPYGTDSNADRPAQATGVPQGGQPDTLAAVGARFAQLRGGKGWTVEDVSARLKVSAAKLRALEAGDLGPMPDTTFALGVVRSYAKMLGVDGAPFAQVLRRERGMPQPDLTMPASAGTDLPRGKVSLSLGGSGAPKRRPWLWGIAAVVVVLAALGIWHTNNGGEVPPWLARVKALVHGDTGALAGQPAAASGVSADNGAGASAPAAEAADDQAASQAGADTGASGAADAAGQASDVIASPAGAQSGQVAQTTPALQAAPAAPAVAAQAAPAAHAVTASAATATSDAEASPAPGSSTFAIHSTQDTWVSVRGKDGKEVFSGLLHAGESREISGVAPLRVIVGNKAGVDSMTYEGQPVDKAKYASAKGNVARFVLP